MPSPIDAVAAPLMIGLQIWQTIAAKRALMLQIENNLLQRLIKPRWYAYGSGASRSAIDVPALMIHPGQQGMIVTSNAEGTATGAVGVIAYDIEGTSQTLAILYSVPYDYNLYENHFFMNVIPNNKAIDHDLYEHFYDKSFQADHGYQDRTDDGYVLSAVMGTNGQTTLIVAISAAVPATNR